MGDLHPAFPAGYREPGTCIQFILIAPIALFEARYICQVYDAAGV